MNLWGRILKLAGWKVSVTVPREGKCVICVAPHTSNWDFIIGLAAYRSLGRRANFLMKEFWFFFPLNILLKALGGIPVPAKGKETKGSLTEKIVAMFRTLPYLNLAVTPEGTRSRRKEWRTGFLRIASAAGVPVQLGLIDFSQKTVSIQEQFIPGNDIEADMKRVKKFYAGKEQAAKYPSQFDY